MTMSTRSSHRAILSARKQLFSSFWQEKEIPWLFTNRFLKNIVMSKQAKNMGTGLGVFDQQKGSVTSNMNN